MVSVKLCKNLVFYKPAQKFPDKLIKCMQYMLVKNQLVTFFNFYFSSDNKRSATIFTIAKCRWLMVKTVESLVYCFLWWNNVSHS